MAAESGSKIDPIRVKLARRLRASLSDTTAAMRIARVAANEYNALIFCLFNGPSLAEEVHTCPSMCTTPHLPLSPSPHLTFPPLPSPHLPLSTDTGCLCNRARVQAWTCTCSRRHSGGCLLRNRQVAQPLPCASDAQRRELLQGQMHHESYDIGYLCEWVRYVRRACALEHTHSSRDISAIPDRGSRRARRGL